MVGDDDGPGVGDLLLGVGHQHAARARLHVGLGVAVALAQAPAQQSSLVSGHGDENRRGPTSQ